MVFGKVASCLAFRFTCDEFPTSEKLHEKRFSVCILMHFSFPRVRLSLTNHHISCASRSFHKKQSKLKERRGRLSTTINYARNATNGERKVFGTQEEGFFTNQWLREQAAVKIITRLLEKRRNFCWESARRRIKSKAETPEKLNEKKTKRKHCRELICIHF